MSSGNSRNGSLRRLKALMVKESLQVVRDPSSILIAFVLPLILLFIFGYGVSLDAKHVRLGIALEDNSPEAQDLVSSFFATPYFDAEVARDRREMLPKLVSGELRGIVVIPQDFTERLKEQTTSPQVQVLTDGSETNTANFVNNYAQGTVSVWMSHYTKTAGFENPASIELASRVFYNTELESRNSLVPGSLAVIMAIIGTILTALVVAREWERGTMEALLATPLGAVEIVIGKLVPYFVLGMGSMAVSILVAVFVFGVPYRGSFLALTAVSAAFLFTALGQGFLISTVSRNQYLAAQIALITAFLPAFILSGFVFEIASMPWLLRQLTRIIPARYFVTNLQTVFLTGDVWAVFEPNILFLLILGMIFLGITLKKTPFRLE